MENQWKFSPFSLVIYCVIVIHIRAYSSVNKKLVVIAESDEIGPGRPNYRLENCNYRSGAKAKKRRKVCTNSSAREKENETGGGVRNRLVAAAEGDDTVLAANKVYVDSRQELNYSST